VESRSLSDKVYSSLRLSILGDDFPPGSPLRIEKLAKELGVSTTPVREALTRLSADGLVDLEHNKTPVVASIAKDEIRQLYAIRRLIEPYFARHLMTKMIEDISLRKEALKIKNEIEEVLDYLVNNDSVPSRIYTKHIKIDHRFQELITQVEKEDLIGKLAALLNSYIFRLRMFTKQTSLGQKRDRVQAVSLEHLRIIDELLEGNAKKLDEAIQEHLRCSESRSLGAYQETIASGDGCFYKALDANAPKSVLDTWVMDNKR